MADGAGQREWSRVASVTPWESEGGRAGAVQWRALDGSEELGACGISREPRSDLRRPTMDNVMTFGEILEAADGLPVDDQESLLEILQRRVVERRREGIARDVAEAHEASRHVINTLDKTCAGHGAIATP